MAYQGESALITNGSQQALYLATQTLCDEGDVVLVEQPTYFVFLEMLRGLGVDAVPVPMLQDGDIDTFGLADLLEAYSNRGEIGKVKALYLVSYYANPSGHSVSRESKKSIIETLAKFGGQIALIEDAAYRELYYDSPFDAESCVSLASGEEVVPVLYTTTLTKPFATGLKVGFSYCTHPDWLARMLSVKGQQDFGTANYNQALVHRVIESGLFDSYLKRLRTTYFSKMDALESALSAGLDPAEWSWSRPNGGLYLWLNASEGINTGFDSDFNNAAIAAGVLYVPGELCYPRGGRKNCIRLSFGVLEIKELRIAAMRFIEAASRFSARRAL